MGRELHLDLAEYYAARRGDYRIIYRIDHDAHALLIVTIDHRADSYSAAIAGPRDLTGTRT